MNLVRSRLSVRNLLGQRIRGMCSNKQQETKAEASPAASAQSEPLFKLPGYRPSKMDKKMLVWAGRFKSTDQIPDFVSFEMIDSARNKVRVKAAYGMMALTLGACILMVVMGKKAAGRNESLAFYNMEKKAKLREEREEEAANALPQKAQ